MPERVRITGHGANEGVDAQVNSDNELHVRNVTADIVWDLITPVYNATTDVYSFSKNASLTATITVAYTDSTKAVIQTVTKVLA